MAKIEVKFNKECSIDGTLFKAGQVALIPEEIGKVYIRTNKCALTSEVKAVKAVAPEVVPEPVKEVKKVVKKTTKK